MLCIDEGDMTGSDVEMASLLVRLRDLVKEPSISRRMQMPNGKKLAFDVEFIEQTKTKIRITFDSGHGGRIIFDTNKEELKEEPESSFYIGGVRTLIKDLFTN